MTLFVLLWSIYISFIVFTYLFFKPWGYLDSWCRDDVWYLGFWLL